ncbi:hypothetical protein EXIGLDRAFT_435015 [Exidia glandulosa HHB12029]|uniref:Uncharacterized protein n=1 Tax=Exidia glandulosa HHB12029 TaxID=1314781 RepID=A0A165KFP8_EXIGL|nr:hypothetical protein EXIGLDRAFT_435015 [Exidia glandulosa HHB12029]
MADERVTPTKGQRHVELEGVSVRESTAPCRSCTRRDMANDCTRRRRADSQSYGRRNGERSDRICAGGWSVCGSPREGVCARIRGDAGYRTIRTGAGRRGWDSAVGRTARAQEKGKCDERRGCEVEAGKNTYRHIQGRRSVVVRTCGPQTQTSWVRVEPSPLAGVYIASTRRRTGLRSCALCSRFT